MRTILVLLLMILLPLQASWSAAAVFCQHETKTGWHWGHHQDETDCQKYSHLADKPSSDDATPQENNIGHAAENNFKDKHKFNLSVHADHLNINQQVIKQQHNMLFSIGQSAELIRFNSLLSVIYQAPILEQPKPPRWHA